MAYGTSYLDSNVVSALFDRTDHAPFAAAPVFNPPSSSGAHPASALTVTLTTGSSGAQMRYTKDGSTPTSSYGTLISGTSGTTTIAASTTITLKALAYGAAYQDSPITSALFDRVDHTVTCVQPVFNPTICNQGTHPATPMTVGLTTTTAGAQMRYTKDGSAPTSTHGTLITGTREQ